MKTNSLKLKLSRPLVFTLFFSLFIASTGFGQTAKEYYDGGVAKYENDDFEGAISDFDNALKINLRC
jgi:hypothetical protein